MPDQNTPAPQPPTWYGTIRNYFTPTDIACMRGNGLDLATYESVRNHAEDIYQQVSLKNMPKGGTPWPPDWLQSFLDWMHAGYPKGLPAAGTGAQKLAALQEGTAKLRVRKDINSLLPEEIDTLKKAFSGIMAKDTNDPNSYFMQAGYHWLPAPNTYCMHHVPGYNPWHRAFMLSFENALRSVPGCENVTLPYWDITTPLPEVLQKPPFDQYIFPVDVGPDPYTKGYKTNRFSLAKIEENLNQTGLRNVPQLIKNAMSTTEWHDFHGAWSEAPNNTIISAHDNGHNSIGDTMSDQDVAAFDPVFWFFHANWDRLFWKWQLQVGATDRNGVLNTITPSIDPVSYQIFTDPTVGKLPPFTDHSPKLNAVKTIDSLDLEVNYEDPKKPQEFTMEITKKRSAFASENIQVHTDFVNVRIDGINRLKIPGSFDVHLLKDGEVIATSGFFQPNEAGKCATCVENAVVHFDFKLPLAAVSGGKLTVRVEPLRKSASGEPFPNKLMGNPTVDVRLLLTTE